MTNIIMLPFHGAYASYDVYLKKGFYANGRIAIKAFDFEGAPAFVATVNVPEEDIGNDEMFIKDYAENQGVLAFLRENHIVTDLVRYVKSGYVDIPLCKFDIKQLNKLVACRE